MQQKTSILKHWAQLNPDDSAVLYVTDEENIIHHSYFERNGGRVIQAFDMNPEEFWLAVENWYPFKVGEVD